MNISRRIIREFRDKNKALKLAEKIRNLAKKLNDEIKIMHVCGTHEHTVTYYGIRSLLPENVKIIAGPGCPVCITPAKEVDEVILLAKKGYRIFTYGDMYKVPGTRESLAIAKAKGADIVIVYGFYDALRLSKDGKKSVFFAVGFETTAPTVAPHIVNRAIPKNLYLYISYRLTVPAVDWMLSKGMHNLQGIIAPGHVSAIVGSEAWRFIPEKYDIPAVVAGFEPLDVLLGVYYILEMNLNGKPGLVNEYSRVVRPEGNVKAKEYMGKAFDIVDGLWRGIGIIPKSRLVLKDEYSDYDIKKHEDIEVNDSIDIKPGCLCGAINLGMAEPTDCPYFGKSCTPEHPIGPCMVSMEGTCFIWYKFGGYRIIEEMKRIAEG